MPPPGGSSDRKKTGTFLRLGEALTRELAGLVGPYVLSDRRWPGSSCVSYRYGGFARRSRLREDGSRLLVIAGPDGEPVPDVRRRTARTWRSTGSTP